MHEVNKIMSLNGCKLVTSKNKFTAIIEKAQAHNLCAGAFAFFSSLVNFYSLKTALN